MNKDDDDEIKLKKKAARKAKPGGLPRFRNIPRNWLHQAVTYMDSGELVFRILTEIIEVVILYYVIKMGFPYLSVYTSLGWSLFIVHTWNWVTNGLFWAVIIFSFPNMRNPGEQKTCDYLTEMRNRLNKYKFVTGVAIYGSVSRQCWHDRSDIDLRVLRAPGIFSLISTSVLMIRERWIAFINKQPMDMYLADDVDFLKKMRSDEIPLFLIKRDARLDKLHPGIEPVVIIRLNSN